MVSDAETYAILLEKYAKQDMFKVLPEQNIQIINPGRKPEFYSQLASDHSISIRGLEQHHASLEEYYMNLKEEG